MRLKFTQSCTVYPDGKTPKRYEAGESDDFAPDYAELLVKKGHAVALDAAPADHAAPEAAS